MIKDVINQIKDKHPQYASHPLMELFEHYIKEYDREVKLIIEVENRKVVDWFVEWLTDNYKEFDDMELWRERWLMSFLIRSINGKKTRRSNKRE